MIQAVGQFYWRCLKRAFSGKYGLAEKWLGGFTLIALLFAVLFPPDIEMESWLNVKLPFFIFASVFLVTTFIGLVTAPVLFLQEEHARGDELEERLKPKIDIALANGNDLTRINWGSTSMTYGGQRFTTYLANEDVVCLLCRNISSMPVTGAIARLLEAKQTKYGVETDLGIVEAIQLPWDRDTQHDPSSITIQPNEIKRIYIAATRQHGALLLYRDFKRLPVEYHRLFMEKGEYQLRLQISGDNIVPSEVTLLVETMEEEALPNHLPRGKANIRFM